MKNKRIVIFGWADSVHIQRWCRGLSGRGFEIKLISVVGAPLHNIETVILPNRGKFSYFSNISKAKEEAVKFNPALVHVHYAVGNGLLGIRSGIRPLVTSVWGSDIDQSANNWLGNLLARKVLTGSDHITATSNYLKSETEKIIKSAKVPVSVIPFGVQIPTAVAPMPGPKPFRICYLKAHKPVYGADILIEALSHCIKSNPDIRLTIAGEPNDYTNQLQNQIERLNLNSFVSFAGQIEHDKIHQFFAEHHLMVMPSRAEGFGVAAAESLAAGRPVIAANVGGVSEIVIDSKTGLLVPPENPSALSEAILKLANDPELCHKMGQAGHEFVKNNFDWEKSLDQMSTLYERMINDSRQN